MSNELPDRMILREILLSVRVGELTLKVAPTLSPSESVAAAADAMRSASHGSALVCEDGKLVGIFTERDLLRVIGGGRGTDMPLSQVMTANPQTVSTSDSLFEAIRLMDRGGYRRLPVVDEDATPVGFVDVKSVVHCLVEHFPSAVYNQASHAHSIARNREGA